jgi:enamine deaminase RidA (YjgF/YER057c/UK114 family)
MNGKFIAAIWGLMMASATLAAAPVVEFRNPADVHKPTGYTHVVVVNSGKLVILAGQVGLNQKGEMAADFAGQVQQAFANIAAGLAAAGAKPSDLVKLNFYVVGLDKEKLGALRAARDRLINVKQPPASTLVGVQTLFREDALIEIEAQAVVP